MDRTGIVLFTLISAFLGGCGTSAKKPEKVLDLRNVYDVKVCPLHHVPLKDGVEPIEYAHISWDFRYFDVAQQNISVGEHRRYHPFRGEQGTRCLLPRVQESEGTLDGPREAERTQAWSTCQVMHNKALNLPRCCRAGFLVIPVSSARQPAKSSSTTKQRRRPTSAIDTAVEPAMPTPRVL